jgi:hypothetical protein
MRNRAGFNSTSRRQSLREELKDHEDREGALVARCFTIIVSFAIIVRDALTLPAMVFADGNFVY